MAQSRTVQACQLAYTLRFLTHAEYSRDDWKDEL